MTAILLDVEDGVATITLDMPGTRNALNPKTSQELIDVCEEVDADNTVGAAIVRGANQTFCSGAERDVLARAGEDPAEPERYHELGLIYQAFVRVGQLRVPTVAAVCGAAVGAGVNLLLATDLRIVAKDARIITGFMLIGIHPGGGHFTLLNRLIGREGTAAMGLFGEEVSGQRAADLGLAWEAVDTGEVDDRARELARRVGRDPELARRVVRSMRQELGPPAVSWEAALEMERAPQMWSLRRRDEGI
jgi:enoyl-CoA hydratase